MNDAASAGPTDSKVPGLDSKSSTARSTQLSSTATAATPAKPSKPGTQKAREGALSRSRSQPPQRSPPRILKAASNRPLPASEVSQLPSIVSTVPEPTVSASAGKNSANRDTIESTPDPNAIRTAQQQEAALAAPQRIESTQDQLRRSSSLSDLPSSSSFAPPSNESGSGLPHEQRNAEWRTVSESSTLASQGYQLLQANLQELSGELAVAKSASITASSQLQQVIHERDQAIQQLIETTRRAARVPELELTSSLLQEQLTATKAAMTSTIRDSKAAHLDELQALRKDLLSSSSSLQEAVAAKDSQLVLIKCENELLQSQIGSHRTQIDELKAQHATLSQSSLRTESESKDTIQALQAHLSSMAAEMKALQEAYEEELADVAASRDKLVLEHEESLAAANHRIRNLEVTEKEAALLRKTIDELRSHLDAKYQRVASEVTDTRTQDQTPVASSEVSNDPPSPPHEDVVVSDDASSTRNLTAELDSLRLVVDMQNEKLKEARRKYIELEAQLTTTQAALTNLDKLKNQVELLHRQNEELESNLETKKSALDVSITEGRKLKDQVAVLEDENRRHLIERDELLYRLTASSNASSLFSLLRNSDSASYGIFVSVWQKAQPLDLIRLIRPHRILQNQSERRPQ
eukprot:m.198145 g.198145  ORF g.198145 m.198145 type:complete len:638 (+) comp53782_c0_seq4:202-2115(+)